MIGLSFIAEKLSAVYEKSMTHSTMRNLGAGRRRFHVQWSSNSLPLPSVEREFEASFNSMPRGKRLKTVGIGANGRVDSLEEGLVAVKEAVLSVQDEHILSPARGMYRSSKQ